LSLILIKFESSNLLDSNFHDALLARATNFLNDLPSQNLITYDSKLTEDMRNNVSRYIDYLKTIRLNDATRESAQDQLMDDSVPSIPPLIAEPYDPNAIDHEKESIITVYYDTYKFQIQAYHQLMDFLPADSRFPVVLASLLERITTRMEVLRVQFSTILRRNKTLDGWFHALIKQGHNLLKQVHSFEQQVANPPSPVLPFSSGPEQSTLLSNWNRLSGASTHFSSSPRGTKKNDYTNTKIKSSPGSPPYDPVSHKSDWVNKGIATKIYDNNNEPVHIFESNEQQSLETQEELTLAQLGPHADIWNDTGKREMFYASDEELDNLWKPTKKARYTKQSTHRPARDISAILDEARKLIGPLGDNSKSHVQSPVSAQPAQEAEQFPPVLAENRSQKNHRLAGKTRNGKIRNTNDLSILAVQQHANDKPDQVISFESTAFCSESSATNRNGKIRKSESLDFSKSINNSKNGKEKAIFDNQNQNLATADNPVPEPVATSSIADQSNCGGAITSQEKPPKKIAKPRPPRFTRNNNDPAKKMEAMVRQKKENEKWILPKGLEGSLPGGDYGSYNANSIWARGTKTSKNNAASSSGPRKRQRKFDKQQNPETGAAAETSQTPASITTEIEQGAASPVPISKEGPGQNSGPDPGVNNSSLRRGVKPRRLNQVPVKRTPGYIYLPNGSDEDSDNIVFISDSE
jgi:hypothetical protein